MLAVPGEVKSNNQEIGLILARIIVFVSTLLIVAGAGMIINLPLGVAGLLAGLVAISLMVFGSLFEVVHISCPDCGHNTKVIKNTGSFQCPECENEMFIFYGKVNTKN